MDFVKYAKESIPCLIQQEVMLSRRALVTPKERSAIVSQKFWYWSKWWSAPGVSLMIRKLRKGTP